MEWVFLILWTNSGLAVMPEKYPAEQCKKFQDKSTKGYVLCIPAPKLTIMKDESKLNQFKDNYGDCIMSNNDKLNCSIPDIHSRPSSQCKQDGFMMICPPIYKPN